MLFKVSDTVTYLLKHHRGLKDHEVYNWLSKIRLLNPHISNLERIHPMDKVLLPERLSEPVPDRRIWQNAFENIPQALTRNGGGNHTAYLCLAGETIDAVAGRMFAGTPYSGMLSSTKRAVLIHNNPFLCDHLADGKIQQFLTTHPKYQQLLRHLKELPEHLLPNPRSGSLNSAARYFRKSFALPYNKWNSSRYLSTIGRQLNGKVQLLKGVGRHATWYIPAAIGIYNVSQAPSQLRMRTLFEEGFGVLGGYAGTLFGAQIVSAGVIGIFAICGICLGPFGLFLTVFICASAGGIAGNLAGNRFGKNVYDLGGRLYDGFFYSAEDFVGVYR